jgi:hypothetical protein
MAVPQSRKHRDTTHKDSSITSYEHSLLTDRNSFSIEGSIRRKSVVGQLPLKRACGGLAL